MRQVADGIAFPNGMVVTPDNATLIVAESFAGRLTAFDIAADGGLSNRRVWADSAWAPDGICIDAEGAIWTRPSSTGRTACVRVREGGEVLETGRRSTALCFACMLGGEDGTTLFMLAADWRMDDGFKENIAAADHRPAHRSAAHRARARAGRRLAEGAGAAAGRTRGCGFPAIRHACHPDGPRGSCHEGFRESDDFSAPGRSPVGHVRDRRDSE